MTLAHDPPGPLPPGVEDQQPPAAIVPADLRACQVNGAVAFRRRLVIPEERTCLRTFSEDTPITKEFNLVRVDDDGCSFPGILVTDQKPIRSAFLFNGMNEAQMTAAFPALMAFERQMTHSGTGFCTHPS